MSPAVRRQELGAFLRNRRARLTPADVGVIGGNRRRTPGLRRNEVADLAGVGLAWYTWLEQARDINVSDDVLGAIARALRLNADERAHLHTLARAGNSRDQDSLEVVPPSHAAVLDALDPNPAHIRDASWNLLAWNRAFAAATDYDHVMEADRNLLWLMFTHQPTLELFTDWEDAAARAVAQFRFECARHLGDESVIALIERLSAVSAEFRAMWSRYDVESGVGMTAHWNHPVAGRLELQQTVFPMADIVDPALQGGAAQRMHVLVPVPGTGTEERLRRMISAAKLAVGELHAPLAM